MSINSTSNPPIKNPHLIRRDQLDDLVQLLDRPRWDDLDEHAPVLGPLGELGQQLVGDLVADQHVAALRQALHRPVQTARRRAEVDHDVHQALARVVRALNQLLLVQVLVPLDHVDSGRRGKRGRNLYEYK